MDERHNDDLLDPRTIPLEALDLEGWKALALELARRADAEAAKLADLQAELARARRNRLKVV